MTPDIFSNNFLSTTSLENSQLSKEELIAEILPKLQDILNQRFPNNPQKQRIKIYPDRLNFAAPCCGDSAKDNSKKRGNIILSGPFQMTYKCHNCGTRMSLYNFFKKYGQSLSLSAIDYFVQHRQQLPSESSIADSSSNYIYDNELINQYAIDREFFKSKFGLEETSINNAAHFYLVKRKQYTFEKFLFQPKYNLLFLLNLTRDGKIIGIQVSHLAPGYKGPKYKTYKLSKIYSDLFKENREIPIEVDSLSMIFNILSVDYNKPVTVVEGPMDSFLIKNCIATCGAGKHVNFAFKFRYLFDDDLTGRKHALEKLGEGYQVFMWDKLKKDLNLPQRQKWDINDLVIYCNEKRIQIPNLEKYYSNDDLDSLDI